MRHVPARIRRRSRNLPDSHCSVEKWLRKISSVTPGLVSQGFGCAAGFILAHAWNICPQGSRAALLLWNIYSVEQREILRFQNRAAYGS